MATRKQLEAAVKELTDALQHTVEYVGTHILPAQMGWSWYDAMLKYAPEEASKLRAGYLWDKTDSIMIALKADEEIGNSNGPVHPA